MMNSTIFCMKTNPYPMFFVFSFDSLCPINNLSVKTGTGLPGLNQY